MKTDSFEITTQKALNEAFWNECPAANLLRKRGKPQNEQSCDVRSTWVDFVDSAHRSNRISDALARRATLKG